MQGQIASESFEATCSSVIRSPILLYHVFVRDNAEMHTIFYVPDQPHRDALPCGIFFAGIVILLLFPVFWPVFPLLGAIDNY